MYMPSYIILNHKGWFCFQHLFNTLVWMIILIFNQLRIFRSGSTQVEGDETNRSDSLGDKENWFDEIPQSDSNQVRNTLSEMTGDTWTGEKPAASINRTLRVYSIYLGTHVFV